jgi:hypothetical protein
VRPLVGVGVWEKGQSCGMAVGGWGDWGRCTTRLVVAAVICEESMTPAHPPHVGMYGCQVTTNTNMGGAGRVADCIPPNAATSKACCASA